jgi:hypothetical protein
MVNFQFATLNYQRVTRRCMRYPWSYMNIHNIYICIHRLYVAELLINSDPQSVVDKISLRKESHPKAPESQELPQGCEEVAHSAFFSKKAKGQGIWSHTNCEERTSLGKAEGFSSFKLRCCDWPGGASSVRGKAGPSDFQRMGVTIAEDCPHRDGKAWFLRSRCMKLHLSWSMGLCRLHVFPMEMFFFNDQS